MSQTHSHSEGRHSGPLHCVVFYWRILIFDFKMSPELWFHSSKGEAFPNIDSRSLGCLQCSAVYATAVLLHAHVVLGVARKISLMVQGPRCSVLEEL